MPSSGPTRTQLANLYRYLDQRKGTATAALLADPPTNDPADLDDYLNQLREAHRKLRGTLSKFKTAHATWEQFIQSLTDQAAIDSENQLYNHAADSYLPIIHECDELAEDIEARLSALSGPPQPAVSTTPAPSAALILAAPQTPAGTSAGQFASSQAGHSSSSAHATPGSAAAPPLSAAVLPRHTPIKPPRINLPVFDGDYIQFKQWLGLFTHNVHNRQDLTNIEKFTFLVDKLGPKAKSAIDGLSIEDGTYDVALDLLKQRFDRAAERMIARLYGDLNKIPASFSTVSSKQDTLDACERIFRQLETAGEEVNSNRALSVQLLGKFPESMIRDLQRYKQIGPNSPLQAVRAAIREWICECETTEAVIGDLRAVKISKDDQRGGTVSNRAQDRGRNYATEGRFYENSALASLPSQGPRKPRVQMLRPPSPCYFCGSGNHFNADCDQFCSAKARQQRLRQIQRCTRCMRQHNRTDGQRCPVPVKCVRCGMNDSHVTALCYTAYPVPPPLPSGSRSGPTLYVQHRPPLRSLPPPPPPPSESGGRVPESGGLTAMNASRVTSLFQTAKAWIVNPATGKRALVRLAMDTLSNRSFIKTSVAKNLHLRGTQNDELYLSVFGTTRTLEIATSLVDFEVELRDGTTYPLSANTTNVICRAGALPAGWTPQESRVLSMLKDTLADDPFDSSDSIDVLLGASVVWEFICGPRTRTDAPKLFVIPSRFGLLLAGESTYEDNNTQQATLLCMTESPCRFPNELGIVACESKIHTTYPDIDEFWDLEKIGISDDPVVNEDDQALDVFKNSVSYVDGRYQVKWPFIPEKVAKLPDNYDMSYCRFRSLAKRLKHEPKLLDGYRDVLHKQLERGIIEVVPDDEVVTDRCVHYLPHHPVVRESSETTKVRIVYDAGAKTDKKGVSLNDCLMRGPVIMPDLCHILMRMRVHEIAIIADIEKAFLQILLHPDDRDTTRFLWFKDDTSPRLADNIAVYRFRTIVFGVKPSPSILAVTLDHHLTNEGTELAAALKEDTFVDNAFHGMNDQDLSVECYYEMKACFARAGMNIQEFCSNSRRLMNFLPEADAVKNRDAKFLGMKWDSQSDDTLRLVSSQLCITASDNVTKRSILQAVASVFDPLGLFQPVLLPAKLLLQRLWDLKYDWDDPVSPDLQQEWQLLRASLVKLPCHRLPRFIGRVDRTFTLAVFCDASGKAYATSVYLRCQHAEGSWSSHLLFAKSRLAPRAKKSNKKGSQITLPRLELLGVVIGVRAATFCRRALKSVDVKVDIFCDSECVHHWIRSRGLLKRFVSSRLTEIRQLQNCEFHFVGTADNPADLSTRGKYAEELFSSEIWWHGPEWLTLHHTEWPKRNIEPIGDVKLQEIEAEIKPVYVNHALAVAEGAPRQHHFTGFDPSRVPSLEKLVRRSVIWLKFLKWKVWNKLSPETRKSKPKLSVMFDSISQSGCIEGSEFAVAQKQWVLCVQQNHYDKVRQELENRNSRKVSPIIAQLGLRLNADGLICTHGRLEFADLSESARAPYLLPQKDRFSTLAIQDAHSKAMQSGVSHTLSVLREKFWVVHGRAAVRRVLRACQLCRIFKTARPFKLPAMPPLPADRLHPAAPFQRTGLDYFGPIVVKVREQSAKMWVCLFTCMVTRAVHLEPVMDCSAIEFLHALIRFVSRRGVPQRITCDNGAQFHQVKILGDHAWKRTPTDHTITSYLASTGISWKFITENAPWQGGFYERLVGLVKSTLRTTIGRRTLTWTDLVTLLTEAEAVVNSRPLTYVGDDPESHQRVLPPSDFLLAAPTSLQPVDDADIRIREENYGEAGKHLLAIWKKRKNVLDKLWKVWHQEYLMSLRERPIASHPSGRGDIAARPRLNEAVLIMDKDLPRGRWKIGRISKLICSDDGHVRSAEVTQSNKATLRRPINLLVPLEVDHEACEAATGQAAKVATTAQNQSGVNEPEMLPPLSEDDILRTREAIDRFSNVRYSGLDSSVHRHCMESPARAWGLESSAPGSGMESPAEINASANRTHWPGRNSETE